MMNNNTTANPSDASSIELMDYESEFTAAQIRNFKAAFHVFDINRDGKISTTEIFEVLHSMGNEVTEERQRKIQNAVDAVDVDGSGDLDFREFISFMRIMNEYNNEETMDMTDVDTPDDPTVEQRFNERALWPYFRKIPINIKLAKESKTGCESFVSGLVWLAFAYNVVHVLYVSVLVAADWNPSFISNQNPGREEENEAYFWVRIVRYINLANFPNMLILLFTDDAKVDSTYDTLQFNGYFRKLPNLIKYVTRHLFLMNMVASVLFVVGIKGMKFDGGAISDNLNEAIFCVIQAITAFFSLSYFLYFDTYVVPATVKDKIVVAVCDILFINWIRLVIHLVKNVISLIMLPFVILFSLLMWFSWCCCPDWFNTHDQHSKTSRFLRCVAFMAG